MSDEAAKPADEPAAVVPDDATEVRPPAADLAGGAKPTPAAEPEGDAAIGGATPAPAVDEPTPAPAPIPDPPAAAPAPAWTPPAPPREIPAADAPSASAAAVQDRPEIAIAGAFAGGLAFALILKRLAR